MDLSKEKEEFFYLITHAHTDLMKLEERLYALEQQRLQGQIYELKARYDSLLADVAALENWMLKVKE